MLIRVATVRVMFKPHAFSSKWHVEFLALGDRWLMVKEDPGFDIMGISMTISVARVAF